MKRPSPTRLALSFGIAVSLAVVALCVAAPPGGASGDTKTYFYVGGHTFGIGEQQVYLVARESVLSVRYRDARGNLQAQTWRRRLLSSVAWTIEGIASGGRPVLGVATAAPTPVGEVAVSTLQPLRSASPATVAPASPSPAGSGASPLPSPILDAQGAGGAGSALADLAPASILLSSLTGEVPDLGRPWKSSGELRLPYGTMTVNLDNVVTTAAGNLDTNVMQIAHTGTTSFQAKTKLSGFGITALRGSGSATGTSFVESQNKLLLGMSLLTTSHGNATAKERLGTYTLSVKVAIKLVKYVPGIPLYTGPPGFLPASGYLGETTAPDTGIYSTAVPNQIGIPAATDTGFIPAPIPTPTPYRSALPEVSLPPIPLPMASDQPAASPPAGPTPTPQPTHY